MGRLTPTCKSVKGTAPKRSVQLPNCPLLAEHVIWIPLSELKAFRGHARKHPEKEIEKRCKIIGQYGPTKPLIVDENHTILLGHADFAAMQKVGLSEAPTVTLAGLSESEKSLIILAENRIPEDGDWDPNALRVQVELIINAGLDISLTGFSVGEIDLVLENSNQDDDADLGNLLSAGPPVTKLSYHWRLGRHSLICGDATQMPVLEKLMAADRAQMVVTDAPYNVRIQGHARGRSKIQHREFVMASGEMSDEQFRAFLQAAMTQAIAFSVNGSIHYWFIDWRHLPDILAAGLPLYSEWKNLLVWRKANAGQGSFYRSHHELVPVFKAGTAAHINNFGLGAEGRFRTNVLDYPGGSTPDTTRREELAMHPTVKPVPLVADLIRDCSLRDGIVLDLFGGSGTTIIAAEETGRVARLVELDPLYVDLAVRRWQKRTGGKAIHAQSGRTFKQMEQEAANAQET